MSFEDDDDCNCSFCEDSEECSECEGTGCSLEDDGCYMDQTSCPGCCPTCTGDGICNECE